MPTSSIADEITRLSACRDDILSAISAKGVTVPEGSVLSSCPTLIDSIPTGGGGTPTSMINTGFWESGRYTFTCPFTATQIPIPEYVTATSVDTRETAGGYNALTLKMTEADLNGEPLTLVFSGTKEQYIQINPGTVYGTTGNWDPNSAHVGYYIADGEIGVSTFTVSADIYGINTSEPYYFMFSNISTWGFTASTADVSAITTIQTGSSLPYPQYASSTTGFMSSTATGLEWWVVNGDSATAHVSGSSDCSAIYNDGPSSPPLPTAPSSGISYVTAFCSTTIQKFLNPTKGIVDSKYSYVYGASASSYSSVTGVNS